METKKGKMGLGWVDPYVDSRRAGSVVSYFNQYNPRR